MAKKKALGSHLSPLENLLSSFAADLTAKYSSGLPANPEDQLKGPISTLLVGAASLFGKSIDVNTEVADKDVSGRPDIGIAVSKLLAGYVELKAPGKGADPAKFKGEDKNQWNK